MNDANAIVKEIFKDGDYIFCEGDVEKHFYIVETGAVQICTMNRQAQLVKLNQINEGESFGEFALLDNTPRTASAVAIGDVTVVKVSEQGFQKLLEELPGWASSMLESFADRLKKTTIQLKEIEAELSALKKA